MAMEVEAAGPFGDDNCHNISHAQQLLGSTRIIPGFWEAHARALVLANRCMEFRGKNGRLDTARVPASLKSETIRAGKEMQDIDRYYRSDPEGISIRLALKEKHASLWPGRMPPLCELTGAEERETRAFFDDLGKLEGVVNQEGRSLHVEEEFEALKERRRHLIRTYAPWWGEAADAAAAAAADAALNRHEPVETVSLE